MSWKFAWLPGLALAIGFWGSACTPDSSRTPTVAYVDSAQGFGFEVPKDWHVSRTQYEIVHYTDVILSVNNQVPDFLLPGMGALASKPRVPVRYPPDWGKLLGPGMVHIVFTYAGGPGFGSPVYGSPVDGFEDALSKALQSSAREASADAEIYNLHFTRWGRQWQVVAWIRKPVQERSREQVVALLKSIHFRDTPVVSPEQAVGAAIQHLPVEERRDPWPGVSARGCGCETKVEAVADGYSVELVRYADEDPARIQGQWAFLVRRNGSVEERPLSSPNRPLQPTAPRGGN